MSHLIAPAVSGRAKCRGCGAAIAKGTLRLGERLPNPFADEGDTTHWYHLRCGAYKRPEPFLEAVASTEETIEGKDELEAEARLGIEHRRLPRVDGAQCSTTGRATCRHCREKIAKDAWRIRLVYWDDGRFAPSGYVHARCLSDYVGTAEVTSRLKHFAPSLSDDELAEVESEIRGGAST